MKLQQPLQMVGLYKPLFISSLSNKTFFFYVEEVTSEFFILISLKKLKHAWPLSIVKYVLKMK